MVQIFSIHICSIIFSTLYLYIDRAFCWYKYTAIFWAYLFTVIPHLPDTYCIIYNRLLIPLVSVYLAPPNLYLNLL